MKNAAAAQYYDQLPKEYIRCPITGSDCWEPLVYGDRYGMGIQTMINSDSGFIATNPRPTESALVNFYEEYYRNYYFSIADPSSDEYLNSLPSQISQLRAQWLMKFSEPYIHSESPNILDIGCGDGRFLKLLRRRYPSAFLLGVEPDIDYATFASKESSAQVLAVDFNDIIRAENMVERKFDIVVLSHVLEHLARPEVKLKAIGTLLTAGGSLLIEVPNILSPMWEGAGMFHIGHINQFYPNTLVALLESCGFEVFMLFHGIHPADPWAMTALARKRKDNEARANGSELVKHIDMIKKYISARSALPSTIEEFRKRNTFYSKSMRKIINISTRIRS